MASPATRSPIWIPIIRGIQILLSLIIIGLSGDLIHGLYFNALGFAIFCVILTWLVTAYNLTTEYITSLSNLRNEYAIIGADALLSIFWLSSMGATAALRASFKYSVDVEGCVNNGQAIDSTYCIVDRGLEKRGAVASSTGLSMMSGVAGLSALEMLLFIACLVYYVMSWYQGRRSKTGQAGYEGYSTGTATNHQQQPYVQQQPQAQQPYAQQQQQYTPQQPSESYSMATPHQPYVQQTQTPQQAYVQQQYAPQQPYGQQVPY